MNVQPERSLHMASSRKPRRYLEEPLWLVIDQEPDGERCFEFPGRCERAIAVGSAPDADYRVEGAPPVAFYIEREGAGIWMTPAYVDDSLRIDSKTLENRRQLFSSCRVEHTRFSLLLTVRDTPPTLRRKDVPVALWDESALDEAFRRLQLRAEMAATSEIDRPYSSPLRARVTAEYQYPGSIPPEACRTATTEMSREEWEALNEVANSVHEAAPISSPGHGARRIAPEIPKGPAIVPQSTIVVSSSGSSDRPGDSGSRDGCSVERSGTLNLDDPFADLRRTDQYWPRPVPYRQPHVSSSGVAPPRVRSEIALTGSYERPSFAEDLPRSDATIGSLLARLGVLTRQRPFLVLVCAAIGAVLLIIFLVGLAQVVEGKG